MDDLRRLYEHQTMMAIGIYSFLDNLLSHIPSRTESGEAMTATIDYPPLIPYTPDFPLGPSTLTTGLSEMGRTESFRERNQRIRLLPRLTSLSLGGTASVEQETPLDLNTEMQPPRIEETREQSLELSNKSEILPGGHPEEIFIYLSDREREEYTCAICYSILKEAHQCQNEHRFCYGCIYTWSTGHSAGHDGCPVCRCDGLYAKNFQLMDRLNRKRTKCPNSGCNWMGVLDQYPTHEHRHYSPGELEKHLSGNFKTGTDQIAVSTNDPSEVLARIPVTNFDQAIHTQPVQQGTEVSTVSVAEDDLLRTCSPVGIGESVLPVADERAMSSDFVRVRRRSRPPMPRRYQSPIRSSVSRRSTPGSMTNHTRDHSQRNIQTPVNSRLSGRLSTMNSTSGVPLIRPPADQRLFRSTTGSSQNTEHRNRGKVPRQITHRIIRRMRHSSSPVQIESFSETNERRMRPVPPTALQSRNMPEGNRLLPLRSTTDSNSMEPRLYRNEHSNTQSPPPIISTEIPASGTYLTARNQLFTCDSTGSHERREFPESRSTSTRVTNCLLPIINHGAPLTSGLNERPNIATSPVNDPRASMNAPTICSGVSASGGSGANQPLEFRRLVPQRETRVTEQLRETREQLAAMLRLMTLELEERRQHVLSATLEAATRSRVLRTLSRQRSPLTEEQIADISESDFDVPENDSLRDFTGRQNHNLTSPLNVLRNLPTPERPIHIPCLRQPLHHLTSRLLGEQFQQEEATRDVPGIRYRSGFTGNGSTSDDAIDSLQTEETSDSSRMRFLGHMRMRRAPTRPSVFFVTGRRNLGHLLSEMRYPQARVNQWSSDEDDDDQSEF